MLKSKKTTDYKKKSYKVTKVMYWSLLYDGIRALIESDGSMEIITFLNIELVVEMVTIFRILQFVNSKKTKTVFSLGI